MRRPPISPVVVLGPASDPSTVDAIAYFLRAAQTLLDDLRPSSLVDANAAPKLTLVPHSAEIEPVTGLTSREYDVLRLLGEGLSNAEIADTLVVSVRTVHAHLRSIYRKLGVRSRTAAVRCVHASTPTSRPARRRKHSATRSTASSWATERGGANAWPHDWPKRRPTA